MKPMCLRLAAVSFLFIVSIHMQATPLHFAVQLPAGDAPFTGRLIVCIAKPDSAAKPDTTPQRPCLRIDESYHSQQGFAVDLSNAKPGSAVILDDTAFGYPIRKLSQLPAGDYQLEAVLNRYEQFHLADGRTLWLPPDRGEGQHWNRKPGNPSSAVRTAHLDPANGGEIHMALDQQLPPAPPPDADSKYLKHIAIRSERLTKFWGRDIAVGAMVLLPEGWGDHPQAHYPVVIYEDHFQEHFRAPAPWRESPPDASATGAAKIRETYGYHFYSDWTGGVLPHVILVTLNHANPYYDDSYAVNSVNVGPYGDAITEEVIPEIERRYRGIGAGWARGTLGGSTGGWEALAQQILFPDFYNGAWGLCPDPVNFHAYQVTNLYEDANAYYRSGPFETVPTPSDRMG